MRSGAIEDATSWLARAAEAAMRDAAWAMRRGAIEGATSWLARATEASDA
jgi:hypothetical protein